MFTVGDLYIVVCVVVCVVVVADVLVLVPTLALVLAVVDCWLAESCLCLIFLDA